MGHTPKKSEQYGIVTLNLLNVLLPDGKPAGMGPNKFQMGGTF